MPTYSLDGDTSGLPRTKNGGTPYEIEAFSKSRTYGLVGSALQVVTVQKWETVPDWARKMVGRVYVDVTGSLGNPTPLLRRDAPEEGGSGQNGNLWCTGLVQSDQYGRPASGVNHSTALDYWPATKKARFRAAFENFPYKVHTDASVDASVTNAGDANGGYGGVPELYRYLQRMQKGYSAEQRIPAKSHTGGFLIAEGVDKGKPIGQVGFRTVSMADVVYKWMRVPVGWPPPKGWAPPGASQGVGGYWPPQVNPINPAEPEKLPARDRFKGTINQYWFDVGPIDGYAWPPETLLYVGYDDSMKYWDAAGLWVCDYVFNFKFKEGGWNKFLSARGEWVTVSLDGETTGTTAYEKSDFDYLFEYEA